MCALQQPTLGTLEKRKPGMHAKASNLLGGVFAEMWKSLGKPRDSLAKACVDLVTSDGEPLSAVGSVEANGRLARNTALRTRARTQIRGRLPGFYTRFLLPKREYSRVRI